MNKREDTLADGTGLLRRVLACVCAAFLLAAPLAACGKKGDPDPPDETSQFPRTYPRS